MSPYVAGKKKNKVDNAFESKDFIKIKKEVQKIKNFFEKNFEYVGEEFPKEVRKIYYEKKKRIFTGLLA